MLFDLLPLELAEAPRLSGPPHPLDETCPECLERRGWCTCPSAAPTVTGVQCIGIDWLCECAQCQHDYAQLPF